MAKQEGIIKLSGKLDDFVAYKRNGEWIVRKKSSINKDRYKKDPIFERMRESNKEFGGASTISSYLRTPWKSLMHKDKDGAFHHRLVAIVLACIHSGEGDKGKRTFLWSNVLKSFNKININSSDPSSHFMSSDPVIEIQNTNALCNIEALKLSNTPKGSTHFKLAVQMDQLTDFTFNNTIKKYTPLETERQKVLFEFPITEIKQPLSSSITESNLSPNETWSVITSIQFFQEVNEELHELAAHPLELTQLIQGL